MQLFAICYLLVLLLYFFNKDKVMGAHIKSIPAIDTWRKFLIQLQALLPDKPVNFFIPSSDTQSEVAQF